MEWNLNRTDTRRQPGGHGASTAGRRQGQMLAHGSVVVPHCSNLAAILNAAEVGVQLGGNPGRASVGRTREQAAPMPTLHK